MATERILFTEEMRRDYTILVPNMLPMHFKMMISLFRSYGYRAELLQTDGADVIECEIGSQKAKIDQIVTRFWIFPAVMNGKLCGILFRKVIIKMFRSENVIQFLERMFRFR